eukprot:5528814-Amphidinium_carterae.1
MKWCQLPSLKQQRLACVLLSIIVDMSLLSKLLANGHLRGTRHKKNYLTHEHQHIYSGFVLVGDLATDIRVTSLHCHSSIKTSCARNSL